MSITIPDEFWRKKLFLTKLRNMVDPWSNGQFGNLENFELSYRVAYR